MVKEIESRDHVADNGKTIAQQNSLNCFLFIWECLRTIPCLLVQNRVREKLAN